MAFCWTSQTPAFVGTNWRERARDSAGIERMAAALRICLVCLVRLARSLVGGPLWGSRWTLVANLVAAYCLAMSASGSSHRIYTGWNASSATLGSPYRTCFYLDIYGHTPSKVSAAVSQGKYTMAFCKHF